jgi:citrate synthase
MQRISKMFFKTTKRNFCLMKQKLHSVIPQRVQEFKKVKEVYGNKKIGEITVNQVLGGMRGITGLFYETSKLDSQLVYQF